MLQYRRFKLHNKTFKQDTFPFAIALGSDDTLYFCHHDYLYILDIHGKKPPFSEHMGPIEFIRISADEQWLLICQPSCVQLFSIARKRLYGRYTHTSMHLKYAFFGPSDEVCLIAADGCMHSHAIPECDKFVCTLGHHDAEMYIHKSPTISLVTKLDKVYISKKLNKIRDGAYAPESQMAAFVTSQGFIAYDFKTKESRTISLTLHYDATVIVDGSGAFIVRDGNCLFTYAHGVWTDYDDISRGYRNRERMHAELEDGSKMYVANVGGRDMITYHMKNGFCNTIATSRLTADHRRLVLHDNYEGILIFAMPTFQPIHVFSDHMALARRHVLYSDGRIVMLEKGVLEKVLYTITPTSVFCSKYENVVDIDGHNMFLGKDNAGEMVACLEAVRNLLHVPPHDLFEYNTVAKIKAKWAFDFFQTHAIVNRVHGLRLDVFIKRFIEKYMLL